MASEPSPEGGGEEKAPAGETAPIPAKAPTPDKGAKSPKSPKSPQHEQTNPLGSEPLIQNTIEPDEAERAGPEGGQDDEAFVDTSSTGSTSISSSVRDYVFENNRRYHKFK